MIHAIVFGFGLGWLLRSLLCRRAHEGFPRISDDPARSSEVRPGVSGVVESHTVDEKGGSAETGGEKAAPLKATDSPHSSMVEHAPYKGEVVGSMPTAATILNELVSAIVTYLVEMSADNLDVLDKAVDKSQAWLMVPPTFPHPSQNQTVSSGVEGAHEGTTADKSGSREPEKLNNAPFDRTDDWEARQDAKRQPAASPELLPTQLPKEK